MCDSWPIRIVLQHYIKSTIFKSIILDHAAQSIFKYPKIVKRMLQFDTKSIINVINGYQNVTLIL